jgi:CRP-like cAMP-binding protein
MRCPTTATVVTTSPVHALVMTPERFRSLPNDSPGFQRRILLAVAERLARQSCDHAAAPYAPLPADVLP